MNHAMTQNAMYAVDAPAGATIRAHRAPDPVPVDDPTPPSVPHPVPQDDPVPDHNPS